jgi:hypothetical protein
MTRDTIEKRNKPNKTKFDIKIKSNARDEIEKKKSISNRKKKLKEQ